MSGSIPSRVIENAKSRELRVTLRIGKEGLSDPVLLELKDQLDSKRLVKLKINKGVVSDRSARSTIISEIEESTGSTSVFTRGNIAVFWKE